MAAAGPGAEGRHRRRAGPRRARGGPQRRLHRRRRDRRAHPAALRLPAVHRDRRAGRDHPRGRADDPGQRVAPARPPRAAGLRGQVRAAAQGGRRDRARLHRPVQHAGPAGLDVGDRGAAGRGQSLVVAAADRGRSAGAGRRALSADAGEGARVQRLDHPPGLAPVPPGHPGRAGQGAAGLPPAERDPPPAAVAVGHLGSGAVVGREAGRPDRRGRPAGLRRGLRGGGAAGGAPGGDRRQPGRRRGPRDDPGGPGQPAGQHRACSCCSSSSGWRRA